MLRKRFQKSLLNLAKKEQEELDVQHQKSVSIFSAPMLQNENENEFFQREREINKQIGQIIKREKDKKLENVQFYENVIKGLSKKNKKVVMTKQGVAEIKRVKQIGSLSRP